MNQQQELTKRVSELYKKEHLTKSEIIELLNIIEELYIITEKINNFDHNKIKKIFSFYESMTKEL
jgi:DNA-directed RNA polymerase specialized sigma subunit